MAVRADAQVDADALSLKISGSGGRLTGEVGGLLDLNDVSSSDAQALRAQFLSWWNTAYDDS
jgi:hypothetical protein